MKGWLLEECSLIANDPCGWNFSFFPCLLPQVRIGMILSGTLLIQTHCMLQLMLFSLEKLTFTFSAKDGLQSRILIMEWFQARYALCGHHIAWPSNWPVRTWAGQQNRDARANRQSTKDPLPIGTPLIVFLGSKVIHGPAIRVGDVKVLFVTGKARLKRTYVGSKLLDLALISCYRFIMWARLLFRLL